MTIATGKDLRLGADFANAISNDVIGSNAVDHPYLDALRNGEFPNIRMALQDFAFQYGLYSAEFVHYMSAVIDNLGQDKHRDILLANLAEEEGNCHDADLPDVIVANIVGQAHSSLYQRFQRALGLDDNPRQITPACPGLVWSQRFLALCQTNEYVGVGAIGIGTELIVARIYDQILEGLKAHSDLSLADRVFFDLHSVCDDEHAAQMLLITEGLAQDVAACEQIRFGVQSAIEMRSAFWDEMLIRAERFPATESVHSTRASSVGHQESL